jgi:hypothetical protein
MKMKQYSGIIVLVSTISASGLALADCPSTMPNQLLEDCIVYEDAGSIFPTDDYAYMDLYRSWLEKQQPDAQKKPAIVTSAKKQ